jgi:cytidine deaminase
MKISNETRAALAEAAIKARKMSYSPYSGFAVGAALLAGSGKMYLGANIENASYTPTVCAERVAIFKAVSVGERELVAIAVAGGQANEDAVSNTAPCGVCRQVMAEFADGELEIILAREDGYTVTTLGELLPLRFDKNNLNRE